MIPKLTEFARVIDWKPEWDFGAPIPQVYSNGNKTFLIYYINEPDPAWDGTYVNIIDNSSDTLYNLALVEFIGTLAYKFGMFNDEVASGSPLSKAGLDSYSAHIIENSSWIQELKKIHKIHPEFSEKRWENYNHYFFFFHDDMFEIIASDYKIETHKTTFLNLSKNICDRLNS
ncbi:hypothetical protein EHQ24_15175 [Leptospira noumeaensis]|uniref:Uncharacterized protein n=1 Tax=Leptospira noumeaensis TaxID=2484964 RepID=A0A4R9I8R9_9LEPT|nr:hypothetical protein [Leptospira noumeaensis]TGK82578.1 hypothetical protein EHQ24_15175 [Leptospira noumeaensis]